MPHDAIKADFHLHRHWNRRCYQSHPVHDRGDNQNKCYDKCCADDSDDYQYENEKKDVTYAGNLVKSAGDVATHLVFRDYTDLNNDRPGSDKRWRMVRMDEFIKCANDDKAIRLQKEERREARKRRRETKQKHKKNKKQKKPTLSRPSGPSPVQSAPIL